jgi:glutamate dehydrogenase
LLDVTDTISGGEIVPPPQVVRHDGDDPYLVVAADKGTATFSDLANAIAAEYGFWLGDAFASGGSAGYDHKKMGITARSAWESVKRHFRELGTDIQNTDFTVVGIGDMSGDVFGNGMLLSEHIRLLAAFDHRHVFLDPDPDAAASFAERRRLFELPRSSWAEYDRSLISEGGGVWPRTAKSIPVSPQAREALGIEADRLAPNELIRGLLTAPVDLLWNGGIGTYVKARTETHADVGDKANDAVRVNGADLRCRVVGEGGNLGFTQRGRVELALAGGRLNTDAIDNAGGVNCSDHEVNIKILLDSVVAAGDVTVKQRNELLAAMTEAVAELVLRGSYRQTQALTLARAQAPAMLDVHDRLMRSLEQAGRLDRALEALPDAEAIGDRRSARLGLTQPELAVLLAYAKIAVYAALLDSDLPEDPYLSRVLAEYFPAPLPERFRAAMEEHRLRREIIATYVTNSMVDRGGSTFAYRMGEDTGAPPSDDALAAAQPAPAARHRRDRRVLRGRRAGGGRRTAGHPRRRRPRRVGRARGGAHRGARARGRRAAGRGAVGELLRARHRRGGHRGGPLGGRRGGAALRARRPPASALAARPDRGAAAREPLAGHGPRGPARRPVQPPRRAHRRRAPRRAGGDAGRGVARRVARGERRSGGAHAERARGHPHLGHLRPHDAAGRAAGGAGPDTGGDCGPGRDT